ncbi:hypothetical protein A0H81_14106 [Grifola frondosa]|uniref:Uncharacterized protein n=1 Tax=Grifola frondosa TaxID=5627 RepID=A0A1C7LMN7_GRIFR|nr:hypothetical protein A0H81_14106 [Grifola frondosa]
MRDIFKTWEDCIDCKRSERWTTNAINFKTTSLRNIVIILYWASFDIPLQKDRLDVRGPPGSNQILYAQLQGNSGKTHPPVLMLLFLERATYNGLAIFPAHSIIYHVAAAFRDERQTIIYPNRQDIAITGTIKSSV